MRCVDESPEIVLRREVVPDHAGDVWSDTENACHLEAARIEVPVVVLVDALRTWTNKKVLDVAKPNEESDRTIDPDSDTAIECFGHCLARTPASFLRASDARLETRGHPKQLF